MQLRRLIEAGADLVIGHHPHTPQGWERWGEGWIFHSLGDFWFESGLPEATGGDPRGYLVRVSVRGPAHGLAVLPYRRHQDVLRVADSPTIDELQSLAEAASSPQLDALWQEVANRLWERRYRPLLAQATGAEDPYHLYRRVARLQARLRGRRPPPAPPDAERDRSLLLTLLLSCESHRWAIESAHALRGGVFPDRRSTGTRQLVDTLLAKSGFAD
jgi:poly-gamma-glutamate synthesis protein (capsule biosynthesis protein)